MIFKMLGIERTWEQNKEIFESTMSRPRQLFVTQSKVLAEKVAEYYANLSQSLAAEHRSKMGREEKYPAFIIIAFKISSSASFSGANRQPVPRTRRHREIDILRLSVFMI